MSRTAQQAAGARAEAAACDYLQGRGLQLVERNYRCRQGEIDLIMRDGEYTVFVEVRYRRNSDFCTSAETVDGRKQRKLISAASHYLQQHPRLMQRPARFDVIAMSRQADGPQIEWIQDAFQGA